MEQDEAVAGSRHAVWRAVERDVDELSETLASAFEDYPWTRWTVDDDDRRSQIHAIQRLTLTELAMPYGEVWVGVDGFLAIVTAAVWMRPDVVVPPSVRTRIASSEAISKVAATRSRSRRKRLSRFTAPPLPTIISVPWVLCPTLKDGVRVGGTRSGHSACLA